ncbi:ATP-binding cassette subfamily B protein [Stella humosa]|uniref:ATP-binding cassette subfamily B protein n=1 Tax=Stella humosa TaxID=94 RepID=A0A3N1M874_9PROT|nr:glucan ABC transporter ATP-binding protein/ permease [Stella humosa]ROP99907.1 ATP-binding cassette subfamily B protein [Stella humosa]BBK30863.1 beta-(1-->2)glucan export ATP-binding/permease protein NdvA [Stella humosa]
MNFFTVYRRVLALLAPERNLVILLGIANLALATLPFLEPLLFGRVVDTLAGSPGRPAADVWADAIVLLTIWGAVGVGGIIANMTVSLHADRLAHRNRLAAMRSFFEHVLQLSVAFHTRTHSGRLLKVMLQGSDHLFGLWLAFFREHLATFVSLVVLLPLSLWLNWRLGLLLVGLIVIFCSLTLFVVRRAEAAQTAVESQHSELAERTGDALANVLLIQSFVRLAAEVRQLGDVMQRLLAAQFPVLNWWALATILAQSASTITVISIFLLGTSLHLEGKATVGEIVMFMGFATLLIARLEHAMSFISRLFFQMAAIADFFAVLDARPIVTEPANAITIDRAQGAVRFEDVTFAYDPGRPALRGISFEAAPGETVALVGPTGAGKSSTLGLLFRLWDPQSGRITIDGHDIRELTLESLRRNIGVVFQESALFFRSIAENLRVGRADATDEELVAAARAAQAHDFIMRQAQGYETPIGERGVTLSGGERQRLAIARAILKDPPILVLDEATSALDSVTERLVQDALAAVTRGRTTFIIAHRLSTIRDADRILVFEDGHVIEQGSFDELMAAGGAFARLVRTQYGDAALA